jgi:hypothetical protein
MTMLYTNTHIHTPYSFSAFESIDEAVRCARDEGVGILGISDFNTMEGYQEFASTCERYTVYPLFNIEFIGFSEEDKNRNFRWNDPKNPGIIYFCGKSLNFPANLSSDARNLLRSLWKGTQDHIWKVINLVNEVLQKRSVGFSIDYNNIRTDYAKNTVRERHVAKSLYMSIMSTWTSPEDRLVAFRKLFDAPSYSADYGDSSYMQNEIRNQLLKVGKPAYIEEKSEAFLTLPVLKRLIIECGGVPCYPVLADEKSGLTEGERDVVKLADWLIEHGIFAVEFIPQRNGLDHLKTYVRHFQDRGFCITFGTEHNTPDRLPMVPAARGGQPFDNELLGIAYDGACILAAHQEMRHQNRMGFVDDHGMRTQSPKQLPQFIRIGDEVIKSSLRKS